jgi:hypothetical protein
MSINEVITFIRNHIKHNLKISVRDFAVKYEKELGIKPRSLESFLSNSKTSSKSMIAINKVLHVLGLPQVGRKVVIERKNLYYWKK